MKARSADDIPNFGEKGAKEVITGLVIAYGINSLATSLAACTLYPFFRITGIPGKETHRSLEDMSELRIPFKDCAHTQPTV